MKNEQVNRDVQTSQGDLTTPNAYVEAKQTTQKIEHIALNLIEPGTYQRPTHPTQVANIVKHFDEAKLGTLTVSLRTGVYNLVDGAHRICALRTLGYTHALCLVLEGLTNTDEADYFRLQDKNKAHRGRWWVVGR